ncbi:MAG: exo-alpha-sialidase [Desulfamplus sp.]|nr:exo-alpha-sialidase [Desulfamplus sp.]
MKSKKLSNILLSVFILTIFGQRLLHASSFVPNPKLTVNGLSTVCVGMTIPVSVKIALNPAMPSGQSGDLWIVVYTSFGWYSYVSPNGWEEGVKPAPYSLLVNLPEFEVLNSTLPAGSYTFYFGVDLSSNGIIDESTLAYSSAEVNITEIPLVSNMIPWSQTSFRNTAPSEPRHVNRIVTDPSGRVHAAWYSQDFKAYMSYSDDNGNTWKHKMLERMTQIHQLIRMSNGTLVAGGESVNSAPMLWYSKDNGQTWKTGANATSGVTGLPNSQSSIIWDLAERQGEVIITTSAETNSPSKSHQVVYIWNPETNTLRPLGSLPGMGALAVAVNAEGTIYVSTQDSSEHDDPETAGEGRVYRSSNGGISWTQTGILPEANRIYALTFLSDGSLVAGSGLNGGFYHSIDGNNWTLMSKLPQGEKMAGNPPVLTSYDVTRVYKIIELKSGALLVGTGNNTGDIFLTCDRGMNWIPTAETGTNNVVWGLDQAEDGTIWIGNGSMQGDVFKAMPSDNVSTDQFYSCSSQ